MQEVDTCLEKYDLDSELYINGFVTTWMDVGK